MDAEDPKGPFKLVTLLIGVNDQFRHGTPEAFRPRFAAMVKRAVGLAGGRPGHVVVISIPDWGVMPFAEGYDRATVGPRDRRVQRRRQGRGRGGQGGLGST